MDAIAAYRRENPTSIQPAPALVPGIRTYSALYAALILLASHVAIVSDPASASLVAAYDADSQQIVSGQVYRCVTALLLHADGAHLSGNMAGILLFGTYAASFYGWGVSWLLILFSGALGNLLTAFWHNTAYQSIGASTAVFGAVGLCAAHALWLRKRRPPGGWRSWAPLAGGLALVAWLGTAPQSDLLAHFFGFICGLLGGSLYVRVAKPLCSWPFQVAALGMVAIGIVGSWYWGMGYRV